MKRYRTTPNIKVLRMDDVKPYWRNPRRITEESVNAVSESIRRYGYLQPIIVDADNVIIVGHTRYTALRRLGVEEVPVVIATDLTPERAKEMRVIDNKTHEYTSWQFEDFAAELRERDAELLRPYFPEIGEILDPGTQEAEEQARIERMWEDEVETATEFVCPACLHEWEVEVTREAILTGRIESNKQEQEAAV